MRTLAAALVLALAACSGPPPDRDFRLNPEEEKLLRPIEKIPEKLRRMIDHGDELFIQATPSYRRSSPELKIADWTTQNAMALDLYTRARESYVAAQAEAGLVVPQGLQDRNKEVLARIVTLQRQRRGSR